MATNRGAMMASQVSGDINMAARDAWDSLGGAYGLRTNIGTSLGGPTTMSRKRFGKAAAVRQPLAVSFNVFNDEKLIKKLMNGPPLMAREMKKIRRKAATATVVPAVKKHIPRSPWNKKHIRYQFRVRRVQLEGTWVAAGSRKFFFAAALNTRIPYVLRGLQDSQKDYVDLYGQLLANFRDWIVTGRPIGLVF